MLKCVENTMSLVKLDKSTIVGKISTKCSEALQQALDGNFIHFASDTEVEFGLLRPEEATYDEDEDYPILHLLIENSQGWSKYPKRQESTIASTLSKAANTSDHLYVVLPVNGSRIAVCTDDDFYTSFDLIEKKFKVKNAKQFEQKLLVLLKAVQHFVHEKEIEEYTADKVLELCRMFDNIMKSFKGSYDFKIFYQTTTKQNFSTWQGIKNLRDTVVESMDPEANGFEIIKVADIGKYKNREIWFKNDCYILSKKQFTTIVDSGKLAHLQGIE